MNPSPDPTNPSPAEPAPKPDEPTTPAPLTLDDMKRGAKTNLDAALSELQLALIDKEKASTRVAKARQVLTEAKSIAVKLGVSQSARKPKAAK